MEDILKMHPADIADLLEKMPEEEALTLIEKLSPHLAGEMLDELRPRLSARLLSHLDHKRAADILEEMKPDEATDLLERLPSAKQKELLGEMEREESAVIEKLMTYPPDSAGGMMSPEVISLSKDLTAGEAIDILRKAAAEAETIYYAYVVDQQGRLEGVLAMRDLIISDPQRKLEEIMNRDVSSVRVDTDREEVARLFDRYDYLALPVVDSANRLLGIVTVDDVIDVMRQEATEDFLKFGGISGGEEHPLSRPRFSVRRRLPWMSANIFLNLIAISAIALFESTIAEVVALAVFMPIISDMGGNVGLQALSVTIRGLAVGEVSIKELWRVVRKEVMVGFTNGLILGAQLGIIAYIWKRSFFLGIVATLALWANTLIAGILGGTLPIILKRLGLDPAMMTGAILTTITDFSGFFVFLGLATIFLERL